MVWNASSKGYFSLAVIRLENCSLCDSIDMAWHPFPFALSCILCVAGKGCDEAVHDCEEQLDAVAGNKDDGKTRTGRQITDFIGIS